MPVLDRGSRTFLHHRDGILPERRSKGVYIARSRATPDLYRFGKGGGGADGSDGSIHDRFSKHVSFPDGVTNGTNEHRPYDAFWVSVMQPDDPIDLQIAEGVLGKLLRLRFRTAGGSCFRADDPDDVRNVAETAADEFEAFIRQLRG